MSPTTAAPGGAPGPEAAEADDAQISACSYPASRGKPHLGTESRTEEKAAGTSGKSWR